MKYLYVLFISALPIIELRGAIPVSQGLNLPLISSTIIAIIGNLLPIPLVYFFAKKILIWGMNKKYISKLFIYIYNKGHRVGQELLSKTRYGLFLGLFVFVAIPFPGTGAYTAILAASLLDLDFKKSFIAISCGVLGAAIIMVTLIKIVIITI